MTNYHNKDYSNVKGIEPKTFEAMMNRYLKVAPLVDFDSFVLPRLGINKHTFYCWRTGRTNTPCMFLWALKAIMTEAEKENDKLQQENEIKFKKIFAAIKRN